MKILKTDWGTTSTIKACNTQNRYAERRNSHEGSARLPLNQFHAQLNDLNTKNK